MSTAPVTRWLRVEAPGFVAACVWRRTDDGPWRCVEAAPILRGHLLGRTPEAARALLEQKGWRWSWLPEAKV